MPVRIVTVGSANTDLIVRADKLPAPGETVLGGDLVTAAGGKGANQAVAAARLGADVTFVGRVGRDAYGKQTLQNFEREGLDSRYLIEDPEAPSGVALIIVGPAGENLIAVAPGANSRLTAADVEAAWPAFEGAGVVLLQLEIPMETVIVAAQAGRDAGATVILNPAPATRLPDALYQLVDIFTPNESEAALLTGAATPQAAATALLPRGPGVVIITLGAAGALLATGREAMQQIPAFPVQAVDTTAAGDAFNGGLAVALAQGQPLAEAVRYASAVGALSVTRFGAQPSLPTAVEVAALLATG